MKRILIVITFLLIAGYGIRVTGVSAAETVGKPAATGMKTQHKTMQTIGAEWSKAKQALAKGSFQAAERAVKKLINVAPNVAKFQPHRNPEKREEFMEYYKAFAGSLTQLKGAVLIEDTAGSAELVKEIDNTCTRCHTAFGGGHQHSPKSKGR